MKQKNDKIQIGEMNIEKLNEKTYELTSKNQDNVKMLSEVKTHLNQQIE